MDNRKLGLKPDQTVEERGIILPIGRYRSLGGIGVGLSNSLSQSSVPMLLETMALPPNPLPDR